MIHNTMKRISNYLVLSIIALTTFMVFESCSEFNNEPDINNCFDNFPFDEFPYYGSMSDDISGIWEEASKKSYSYLTNGTVFIDFKEDMTFIVEFWIECNRFIDCDGTEPDNIKEIKLEGIWDFEQEKTFEASCITCSHPKSLTKIVGDCSFIFADSSDPSVVSVSLAHYSVQCFDLYSRARLSSLQILFLLSNGNTIQTSFQKRELT